MLSLTHDSTSPIGHCRLGRLCDRSDIPKNKRIIDYAGEKITHKESSDREDRYLKQRTDLVLHAEQPLGDRRRRRRQHRAVHQPRVQAELLLPHRRRRDLDPRRAQHPEGRRALSTTTTPRVTRRSSASAGRAASTCCERAKLVYLHGFASSPRSSKARFVASARRRPACRVDVPGSEPAGLPLADRHRMIERWTPSFEALPRSGRARGIQPRRVRRGAHAADGRVIRQRVLASIASSCWRPPSISCRVSRKSSARIACRSGRPAIGSTSSTTERIRCARWVGRFMADARRYDAFAVQLQTPTLIYQGTATRS